jgi:hypothetical protein
VVFGNIRFTGETFRDKLNPSEKPDDVLDAMGPLEKTLRRPVNPTIYSLEDLKALVHEGSHVLQSLKKSKKVFLIGGEDEFGKAATTRLVQG